MLTSYLRFRWVTCQMDEVLDCYSDDIQDVLGNLPADLDETYERTLRDISNQKRKYAQRLFQCLLVSIRPLYVEELAAILLGQFDGQRFSHSGTDRMAQVVCFYCSTLRVYL